MPQVIYRDGRGPAQRIADRLRSSSPSQAVGSDAQSTTQPTRTITNVYYAASQQGGQRKGDDNGQ